MPIGINSPARNLFLLGSSGAQVVSNFFRKIQQPTFDDYYQPEPTSIAYDDSDENYIISGDADTGSTTGPRYGWIEKRQEDGTAVWDVIRRETTGQNVFISAMELKGDDLIVAGKSGSYGGPWTPWIAKYTNGGTLDWQSTTNTGDLEYTGIAIDSNNNYYACGNTDETFGDAQAFVEKFDASGNPGWGKSAFMLGRDVVLTGIDTNSRGHVVAVGYIEDDRADKGYIVKIDANTGEVLWDRTLESFLEISQFASGPHARCNDVHIDSSDNIYVIATTEELNEGFAKKVGHVIKYSPEGNIIWQNETDYSNFGLFELAKVEADDQIGNVVVFGQLITDIDSVFKTTIVVSKYNSKGDLLFRRSIINSNTSLAYGLDSDPSYYYLLFTTTLGNNDAYTYGKVSVSGNGLGDFEYLDGQGNTLDYKIVDIEDRIGRLSDGSLQNNRSDLITYPFNGTKILFDDLATRVTNKKRQMDSADSFEYSGSPAIRPADFVELDLGDESFDVTVPAAEVVYDKAGTYTFTVPDGVTEVSAVVVGSGGGAASCPGANAQAGGGGGGGGLAYGNFTVTPGEDLTIVVGNFGVGGASGTTAGTAGESTTISRGATVLLEGGGGAGGQADAPAQGQSGSTASGGTSSGTERDGGGSGGAGGTARYNWGGGGGGGAGGYTGNGGNAGNGNNTSGDGLGLPGSGGGGGGGGGQSAGGTQNNGGGGVGLFGGPINGAGGTNGNPGSGGSNGQGGSGIVLIRYAVDI